jgi:hypothetical protein
MNLSNSSIKSDFLAELLNIDSDFDPNILSHFD